MEVMVDACKGGGGQSRRVLGGWGMNKKFMGGGFHKLQVFHFRSTVHTNTKPTVFTHSYVLQKPSFCNDNGYKFELKNVEQIGTSVSFWPK